MLTHDQFIQFLYVAGGSLAVAGMMLLFGLGFAMDVTALQDKRTRAGAAADLVVTGGDGIALFYLCRWLRRRRRLRKVFVGKVNE